MLLSEDLLADDTCVTREQERALGSLVSCLELANRRVDTACAASVRALAQERHQPLLLDDHEILEPVEGGSEASLIVDEAVVPGGAGSGHGRASPFLGSMIRGRRPLEHREHQGEKRRRNKKRRRGAPGALMVHPGPKLNTRARSLSSFVPAR